MQAFDFFLKKCVQAFVYLTYEIVLSAFEQFVKRLLFLSTVDPP